MPQIELKKVYGLEVQSNSYSQREGSLERAKNITLSQDDIYKKRRGFKTFYDPTTTTIRNLGEYADKIVGFNASSVQVYTQDASGDFSSVLTLGGVAVAIAANTKARYVLSNNNLYFKDDTSIKKLESTTANVLNAGIDGATDMQVYLQTKSASESFFRPNSQVAYRALFGRKDANNNKILGAPSQVAVATNSALTGKSFTSATNVVSVTSIAHGLSVSDVVYVYGCSIAGMVDGNYTVTGITSADIFTFTAATGNNPGTVSYGTFKTTNLDIAVPSGVNSTEFFCQIYRTTYSASSVITPDESTLQLVDEFNLTSGNVSAGFIVYSDSTPDVLRGAYLYTNPNTGEPGGIAAANDKPPLAQDIALFKNFVFYGNCSTPYILSLNLSTSNTTTFPTTGELKVVGAVTRNYIGSTGAGNRTLRATSISVATPVVTITYASHGFSNGDYVAVAEALDVSGVQIANLAQGNYVVSGVTASTFDLTGTGSIAGLTTVTFRGVYTAAGKRMFYIDNTSSTAVSIDTTARSIVRALNSDTSGEVYAFYTSSVSDVPGKMQLKSRSLTQTFTVSAVSASIVDSFTPSIPTSSSTVTGTRVDGQGFIYFSKYQQPEAVPAAQNIPVGSRSSAILRIAALRDSLIIVKEDGVYRLNGSSPNDFSVTILDATVICKGADTVATLNNQVFFMSDQGCVAVSETAARIVSRPIEPLLVGIIGKSYFTTQSHAVAYGSERAYLCTTVSPQEVTADTVYCFNSISDGWSTWDSTFLDAIVKSTDDKLYYVTLGNLIKKERKDQNRLDYCDANFSALVLTTPSTTTATFSITTGVAAVGDVIVFNSVLNRITSISGTLITFARAYSFVVGDVGTLYQGISTDLITSPMVAGDSSVWKQFSEFQIGYRNSSSMTKAVISFLNDTYDGSSETTWLSQTQTGGWGDLPWGSFLWGLEDGTNIVYESGSAQRIRLYVPLDVSRGTFIQARIQHTSAAEAVMIQSLAYTARVYGQRVTR